MASSAARVPSTGIRSLQIARFWLRAGGLERWLEAERDQLSLWLPVLFGLGIALWFELPDPAAWGAAMLAGVGIALAGCAVGGGRRASRVLLIAGLACAVGTGRAWLRADRPDAVPLARPMVVQFEADVARVEPLPARELVRLRLVRAAAAEGTAMPPTIRVNLAGADVPPGLTPGARIRLRARLMPPPEPSVPGAYDYARVAWFDGVGATGRGFAPVEVLRGGAPRSTLRERLATHIETSAPGAAGGIAAALATGDQGGIPLDDANAMRRAGLAHLLSVSGLHITAVVGATMLLVLRLLALSPWLALRVRLPLVAGGAGALAAIGYTWLTGAEVPTVRSCVAALLVLLALAIGRQAMTLRLVAAGATVVLVVYPEALVGPSFQLSFAAIVAIVALHEHPRVAGWFAPQDETLVRRMMRSLASLLLTGLVVEWTLIPIGLFHFQRAGLYGALANIVAIPLTTFVTMPLEAGALLLDAIGLGAPLWWLTAQSLDLLLWLARTTAGLPGAVAPLPAMPAQAFALMIGGGLWTALWRTPARWAGLVPLVAGAAWALLTPAPDLLVTGDGRHLAVRTASGGVALLRDRTGDYTADLMAESTGLNGEPSLLSDAPDASCNQDTCLITRVVDGRRWRILATRSTIPLSADVLANACAAADIVVSDRRLPRRCHPRWLRLDAWTLARTGGVAISLGTGNVRTVRHPGDRHPWVVSRSAATARRAAPARGPARGRSAAGHRRGWRDRAAP